MIKAPDNIVLVTLPRSGSTSLMSKMLSCMVQCHGESNVYHLGEASSSAGLLGLKHHIVQRMLRKSDYSVPVRFNHWQIEDDRLFNAKSKGDPRDEFQNRVDIVQQNWSNNVIMKHIISQNHETVYDLNNALYTYGNNKFHTVLLWRKDLLGLMSSKFVSEMTRRKKSLWGSWVQQSSHGIYEWNGEPIGNPNKEDLIESFVNYSRSIIDSYMRTFSMLPKNKTFLIETKDIDSVVDIVWSDDVVLPGLDKVTTNRTESNKYVVKGTAEQVKPKDMIHPDIFRKITTLCNQIDVDYDWQKLDKRIKSPWLQ